MTSYRASEFSKTREKCSYLVVEKCYRYNNTKPFAFKSFRLFSSVFINIDPEKVKLFMVTFSDTYFFKEVSSY